MDVLEGDRKRIVDRGLEVEAVPSCGEACAGDGQRIDVDGLDDAGARLFCRQGRKPRPAPEIDDRTVLNIDSRIEHEPREGLRTRPRHREVGRIDGCTERALERLPKRHGIVDGEERDLRDERGRTPRGVSDEGAKDRIVFIPHGASCSTHLYECVCSRQECIMHDPVENHVEEQLVACARALCIAGSMSREEAERTLIGAGLERAIAAMRAALLEAPFSDDVDTGRIALLLGAMKARDAIPEVLYRLGSTGARASERASLVRALAEIIDGRDAFDDRVRDVLEILVADPDRTVRAFAALAFGALGDARSRPRVEALLRDADPFVRGNAEQALSHFAPDENDGAPVDFASLVADANEKGGAMLPWLTDLGDPRRPVREAAIARLVAARQEAVPFLIDKLNQPLTRARIAAARALGQIQAPAAVVPLVIAATSQAGTSEEEELRAVSLRALANSLTGLEEGIARTLLPLADDKDPFVRAGALLCLGRLSDRAGIRAIVRALHDSAPFVVESAAIALSEGVREEDEDIVLPLLGVLDGRPSRGMSALVEAVLIALSRISLSNPALTVRVRHRVRREVHGPTAAIRRASLALLENLFSEDDPPPLVVLDDALVRLADEHPEVRVCAASFLARHLEPGMTGIVPVFEKALARRERTLSLLCLEALARQKSVAARQAIDDVTNDTDGEVAERARMLALTFGEVVDEWTFRPKTSGGEKPARGVSQRPPERPSRVRPVAEGAGTVVEARDAPVEAKAAPVDADDGSSLAKPAPEGEQTRAALGADSKSVVDDAPAGAGEPEAKSEDAGGDVVIARFDQ
jgi:HEAT repeat protein